MRIFEQLESEVRSYVRSFPVIFDTAEGSFLFDEQGNRYIDFFSGAGTLNYGQLILYLHLLLLFHNTLYLYIFLQKFYDTVLAPRNLEYKIQFTGPTGTNAVESALKLARMVKGRSNVIAFTNAFHGLTMGALAVTGNNFYRDEFFGMRSNVDHMPYDGYFGPDVNTIEYLRRFLEDKSSGIDLPAAIIVETVQGEGGIHVASVEWLQQLEQLCHEFDILLIVDDIQVGNGRTGTFFSFERAGIKPDMVTLSKSIGGGLPLALLLMRPELDQWKPGEHTGTFRGNNLAFVASTEALAYWDNEDLAESVKYKGQIMEEELTKIRDKYPQLEADVRGVGMVWGLEIKKLGFAGEVSKAAFENGLVIELSGAEDQVIKFLPSLVIDEDTLREGIGIIDKAIGELLERKQEMRTGDVM
ncbi:MAG: diaminobutyrate--2-oxoglutarate transaminase [Gammaproteobacteria bacterium]